MIDFERYNRLQPKGFTQVIKGPDDIYWLTFKRFSVEDGKEISPERQAVNIEDLTIERERTLGALRAIDSVLEEIAALPKE